MEQFLGSARWFTGAEYGIADIALFAYTDVAHQGGFDLAPFPALRDWLARVRNQPGFVAMPEPSAENAALLAHID
jgi:glutathione S-transferase